MGILRVPEKSETLVTACKQRYADACRRMLADTHISAVACGRGLEQACVKGHTDVVRVLLADERCDAETRFSSMRTACFYGHVDIVCEFLRDEQTDCEYIWRSDPYDQEALLAEGIDESYNPEDDWSFLHHKTPFGVAAGSLQSDVVRLVLASPRVDISAAKLPFYRAVEMGDASCLRVLLADARLGLPPDLKEDLGLFSACCNGKMNVLRMLIADGRFIAAVFTNKCLFWAVGWGQLEVVRLLLGYPNVDPSYDNNAPLGCA